METGKQEIIKQSQSSQRIDTIKDLVEGFDTMSVGDPVPDYAKITEDIYARRSRLRGHSEGMPPGILEAHPDPFDRAIDIDAA